MNKFDFNKMQKWIILGLMVIIIAVFAVVRIKQNIDDKAYNTAVNTIIDATKKYTIDNHNIMPSQGQEIYITIKMLKDSKYLKGDVINPKTNKAFNDSDMIQISNSKNNYIYKFILSK